jgi:hypothetical protein
MSAAGTERCDDEDCVICYPMFTRTGRAVTPGELEEWAEEAEAGYDVDRLLDR